MMMYGGLMECVYEGLNILNINYYFFIQRKVFHLRIDLKRREFQDLNEDKKNKQGIINDRKSISDGKEEDSSKY
jgi:hypothetical protein